MQIKFSDSAVWQNYGLTCCQFFSSTGILCFCTFISQSLTLESAFYLKDKDTGACTQVHGRCRAAVEADSWEDGKFRILTALDTVFSSGCVSLAVTSFSVVAVL